jgi:hypothetical protein
MITFFFEMWVTHNNMLKVIMSDYDTKFTSNVSKVLMNKAKFMLKLNMAFHPQIDGLTKRVNRVLNQYFWNYVGADHKDWCNDLGLTKKNYNSTKHSMTRMSPFELVVGLEANNSCF